MKHAAVGFRVHSGWTAVVAVALEKAEPRVLARQRIQLVETFTYYFRQPYHTAKRIGADKGGEFISGVASRAKRLAEEAIRSLQSSLRKENYELSRCGLLLASGRVLPSLDKILASHALIHTADGELFRQALLDASRSCGLAPFTVKERELVDTASRTLGVRRDALTRRLTALGKPFGAPWSQDEKFAALVAWLSLSAGKKT
ncbi:MAG TPA: hypothetical protein VOA78_10785 [Candidatus Dormibacteraeota bacterium]|nr:hypothetical protein [Candidatus Dormibacteraeota bacterium]